jgi:ubiquitin-protein ligase E3 C
MIPLSTYPSTSPEHQHIFSQLFSHILTIPLLLYRIPLASLTHFSSHLPLDSLHILSPSVPALVAKMSLESKIDVIANLVAFTPPRYAMLPADALIAYLSILTTLMDALPVNALSSPASGSSTSDQLMSLSWVDDSDSDSESPSTQVAVVSSFQPKPILPPLEARTRKRLSAIPDPKHLNSLLTATQRHPSAQISLVSFLLSLGTIWPSQRDKMLSTVVVYTGGGLVKELYKGYVRTSSLGRDDNSVTLTGTQAFFSTFVWCY